jgi:hypothetical protein
VGHDVQVYGIGAVAVHVMAAYSTDAFVMAYFRFAARYGHPLKLLPDDGSQLLKACKEMDYSWEEDAEPRILCWL